MILVLQFQSRHRVGWCQDPRLPFPQVTIMSRDISITLNILTILVRIRFRVVVMMLNILVLIMSRYIVVVLNIFTILVKIKSRDNVMVFIISILNKSIDIVLILNILISRISSWITCCSDCCHNKSNKSWTSAEKINFHY